MKRPFVLLGLVFSVLSLQLPSASALKVSGCWETKPSEKRFVRLTNSARSARDIRKLTVDVDLSKAARLHSRKMAAQGKLFHSTAGDIDPLLSGRWVFIGENVGYGATVEAIQNAFMGSKYHRRNVLDRDFKRMGVGVVREDGLIWVTVWFQQGRDDVETTFRMQAC